MLILSLLGLVSAATFAAPDVENRVILIDQSDWTARKGFCLSIENRGPDGPPLPVTSARLILAVADGTTWRYVVSRQPMPEGKWNDVEAVVSPTEATLRLNGEVVGSAPGAFQPLAKDVTFGNRPSWASAPTAYWVQQGESQLQMGGSVASDMGDYANLSALARFESPAPRQERFQPKPGSALRITTRIRMVPASPDSLKGLVDRYGQAAAASWPTKVHSDRDLKASVAKEQEQTSSWTAPTDRDPYGGWKRANWHENPTGFFRVVKHGNAWWMVSPQGNPLFYTGVCTSPALMWERTPVDGRESLFQELPPKTGPTAELWTSTSPWGDGQVSYFAPHAWNMMRKFGPGWKQKADDEFVRRVRQWGFSGQGKWSDQVLPSVPYVSVLELDVPKLVRHPDVFDASVQAAVRRSLQKQLDPLLKDPRVVGTSIGNEFDEIVTTDEVRSILNDHPDSPSAKAIRSEIGETATLDSDTLEKARQFYAKAYYGFLYRTVKSIDPNHLYLGFWIVPGWWQNDSDWDLITPYCDVIGYDRYAQSYAGIENLLARRDKPTLCGEFSFPAWYGGSRGMGRYDTSFVETDADSGRHYAAWVAAASRDPKCVGTLWFQYRDEPLTGRGPGKGNQAALGEHYAFGLVDGNDQPKWELVRRVREANLKATGARVSAFH